jgi:hypothetical protein
MRVDTGYLVGCDLGQAADYTALAIAQRFEDRAYFYENGEELEGPALDRVLTCRDPRAMPEVRLESSTSYDVVHLERLSLGTPYPKVVTTLREILTSRALAGNARLKRRDPELVVDATGVGRPVVDHLRAAGLQPIAITITGGDLVAPGRPGCACRSATWSGASPCSCRTSGSGSRRRSPSRGRSRMSCSGFA